MTDQDAMRQTREWWDHRASTVEELPEVVGVGRHPLEASSAALIERTVREMLSCARGRELCMDGACGVGLAFPTIESIFTRVFGLDFSPNVIRRIPEQFRKSSRVILCNGSITALPLRPASLDAIHCRDLLQCLPASEVRPMFEEFRRVLKPGGIAVVHFKNSQHMRHRIGRIAHRIRRFGLALKPLPDPLATERFVPGDTYLRPWSWYLQQVRNSGLRVERRFSWQWFFWGRLERRGLAKPVENIERLTRRLPILKYLVRNDGINYYVLIRKPD